MYSDDPWGRAQDRFNKFARMDSQLAGRLNDLSEQQANEDKLAFALEAGRIYGLRSRKCYVLLRRELGAGLQSGPCRTFLVE